MRREKISRSVFLVTLPPTHHGGLIFLNYIDKHVLLNMVPQSAFAPYMALIPNTDVLFNKIEQSTQIIALFIVAKYE
ncbi:hypothetical protein AXW37_08590 [Yersinia ruckeri]|uniref:Uncharacterized protein n=1 Tax=Yersinia ruckeri TaxID=29486 RepID=A0A0A5HBX6_YERRU|nr:hypothetical protein UGYR_01960 [Yersinia ruckeri]AUQ43067.1 hypothetical protein NJ56_14845 [Yersinia ruckeri]OEU25425.1 hypothetical protein BI323_03790 [Yersinia ruckeri]OIX36723.1 hypothetical protein AXW19_08230 [Yersinia ruckeri]OIX37092.1 hypothetical protein AXW20_08250 [Yersinia ruckeri]